MRQICIVDDDNDTRQTLVDIATELGYRVNSHSDAEEAINAVGKLPDPDVAIIDQTLPIGDGVNLIKAIRQAGKWNLTHIILVTAMPVRMLGEIPEYVMVLEKPFDIEVIVRLMEL